MFFVSVYTASYGDYTHSSWLAEPRALEIKIGALCPVLFTVPSPPTVRLKTLLAQIQAQRSMNTLVCTIGA